MVGDQARSAADKAVKMPVSLWPSILVPSGGAAPGLGVRSPRLKLGSDVNCVLLDFVVFPVIVSLVVPWPCSYLRLVGKCIGSNPSL